MTPLFELLENSQLMSGSQVNQRRVLQFSARQLSDIGAEAAVLTQAEAFTREIGT